MLQSDEITRVPEIIPARAGVGLKAEHYREILQTKPDIGWFEVHAENYMGAGGPPHAYLTAIREHYPLSLHGVGLSIGADRPLDTDHIDRLKVLIERYEPGLVSEHLAWSSHGAAFLNDLLPVPYHQASLDLVCDHLGQVQDRLGQAILLENPSTYVSFSTSDMEEVEFLSEIARRSGCGLLLDVNNVHVSTTNHDTDPIAYLNQFPVHFVGEIHLAGFATDTHATDGTILIDAHDRQVAERVWELYAHTLGRCGAVPTLIEWDNDIPDWSVLSAEAARAEVLLSHQHDHVAEAGGAC